VAAPNNEALLHCCHCRPQQVVCLAGLQQQELHLQKHPLVLLLLHLQSLPWRCQQQQRKQLQQ
jgi:hypothetical protein